MKMSRTHYPLLRETTHTAVLSSGLSVILLPRRGYQRFYGLLMVNYGSNDGCFLRPGDHEPSQFPDGIAHFLEHQLFAKQWGNADERFATLGASTNAYTSWNRTGYLFSTTANYHECLKLLLDLVQEPYFTQEGVIKEQGIIDQEISMYDDDASWKVYSNLLEALYHLHPVRRSILGTPDSISSISKQLLDDCYRTFYQPNNMVLVTTGDFEVEDVMSLVAKYANGWNQDAGCEIRRVYPDEPKEVQRTDITSRMSVGIPLFALGFKDSVNGECGEELQRKQLLSDLVLQAMFGDSSDLYQRLYSQGLIDEDFDSHYVGASNYAYTVLSGASEQPEKLRDEILIALEQALSQGMDGNTFERSRRALYGQYLQDFNSIESVANELGEGFFDGVDYLDYLRLLSDLTLEEANQRMRALFRPDRLSFSQVIPN